MIISIKQIDFILLLIAAVNVVGIIGVVLSNALQLLLLGNLVLLVWLFFYGIVSGKFDHIKFKEDNP